MSVQNQQVLFFVFLGFFILIGLGSLATLLGFVKGVYPAFRKWAVAGFVGSVTLVIVSLFKSTFTTIGPIVVTLLPPLGNLPAPAFLEKGTFRYDEVVRMDGNSVKTHSGDIVAVLGQGGGWEVQLPGEVVDKAVKLSFRDQAGSWWEAGPFWPNRIRQEMRQGTPPPGDTAALPLLFPRETAVVLVAATAATPMSTFALQQQASIKFSNYARRIGDKYNQPYYEWRVFVDEPQNVLDTIQQIDYELHPTFIQPFQSSRDRDHQFELKESGWGEFRILITVRYTNGTQAKASYPLSLKENWPAPLGKRVKLDKIHVIQDGSPNVTAWVFDILVDGKKFLTLPRRNYTDARTKNDYVAGPADRWVGDIKVGASEQIRIDINGKRPVGGDTAIGTGTLTQNGKPVIITASNKDPQKGAFEFSFSVTAAGN